MAGMHAVAQRTENPCNYLEEPGARRGKTPEMNKIFERLIRYPLILVICLYGIFMFTPIKPKELFVSYLCWKDNETHYTWSTYTGVEDMKTGDDIKRLTEQIKKINGYDGMSIISWRRVE